MKGDEMKKIIVYCLLLVLVPLTVHAGACGNFSYEELKDMEQTELLETYCKVRKDAPVYIDVHFYAPRRDKFIYQADAESCRDMLGLLARVCMKRFDLKNIDDLVKLCK
jgi:hypothetical protein